MRVDFGCRVVWKGRLKVELKEILVGLKESDQTEKMTLQRLRVCSVGIFMWLHDCLFLWAVAQIYLDITEVVHVWRHWITFPVWIKLLPGIYQPRQLFNMKSNNSELKYQDSGETTTIASSFRHKHRTEIQNACPSLMNQRQLFLLWQIGHDRSLVCVLMLCWNAETLSFDSPQGPPGSAGAEGRQGEKGAKVTKSIHALQSWAISASPWRSWNKSTKVVYFPSWITWKCMQEACLCLRFASLKVNTTVSLWGPRVFSVIVHQSSPTFWFNSHPWSLRFIRVKMSAFVASCRI